MNGLTEWARDLLMSRGALLETDQSPLRALLPADLAAALGCGEWLSLNFEASAGADDAGEWLERIGALLAPDCPTIGARLRDRSAAAVRTGAQGATGGLCVLIPAVGGPRSRSACRGTRPSPALRPRTGAAPKPPNWTALQNWKTCAGSTRCACNWNSPTSWP